MQLSMCQLKVLLKTCLPHFVIRKHQQGALPPVLSLTQNLPPSGKGKSVVVFWRWQAVGRMLVGSPGDGKITGGFSAIF